MDDPTPNAPFTEPELRLLDLILSTLARRGSPTMALRNPDFGIIRSKVDALRARARATSSSHASVLRFTPRSADRAPLRRGTSRPRSPREGSR